MPLSERSTLCYAVVICTLDRRADLLRCIDSWLRQDPPPLEIVVVHGGTEQRPGAAPAGVDRGTGVAFAYRRMPPSLVRQRNAGIELARGDVVFFADDDAVYLDGYAAAVLAVYEADREGGSAASRGRSRTPAIRRRPDRASPTSSC